MRYKKKSKKVKRTSHGVDIIVSGQGFNEKYMLICGS